MDALLTSISLGLLASASPCILPLYPGYLAYLSGAHQAAGGRRLYGLGFFVLAGVLTMMLALGLLIAMLSISIGSALAVVIPLADILIIALGIFLLLDKNPFKALPQLQAPALRNPLVNAFVYGLLYGPIALPCSGPLIVSIFALSLTAGEALSRLTTFLTFGLGFGLPLLALSLISAALQQRITRWIARRARQVNLLGGLLLVGIGIYDLWANWENIRLVLGG
ncbi:MAG: cytochrome c biogenesis CcdA family protein [Chloroflexi bacterium]|nr:cytochrome c biogenesis CcdA family protein [Chloroflexota bacterium]